ncbi:hypothetical protein L6164_036220 [Bauhinia variegata]|uniref:Uncharacterized protein n=1 Tax=Bauhinia variegata TaxID=167791 RepID=A0ACB9KH53_BAUVA|nr:hypothetical protein L6164_036220 [Bauhinia variegata]
MEDGERLDEKSFLNGDAYIGKIKSVLPHGKGKYTWSDGTVYEGDWEEGKRTGKGLIVWPSGASYEGEFSGGYLHGHGTFKTPDGSIYTGTWRMSAQHGIGRKEYSNLDFYEGLWKEGIREGSGRYSWNNGDMFTGNWIRGKIEGRGVMKWTNGDIFDGWWLNGVRHGSGVYRFGDGGLYIGTWSKGLKDGKGTFYPAGSKQPSLRKWSRSLSCNSGPLLNSKENGARKSRVKRCTSEKVSASGSLGSSFHISLSQRTSSLDENVMLCDHALEGVSHDSSHNFAQTFGEGQPEEPHQSNSVHEREYMQGVLIMERIRKHSESSDKNKRQNKFSVKQVKKSSCLDIFRGRRSYYLKLNLQLGIRYTVGKITPVPARDVRSSDFGVELE